MQLIVRGQTAAPPPSAAPAPAGTTPPAPMRKGDFQTEFKMKSGSYLGFGQVNLGMGEIGFKVVVFCQNKEKKNGRLEFRIDRPKGKKSKRIGTLKIPFTGDTTYALKLVGNPKYSNGIHDLYLVAKGNPFSITSIQFVQDY
ncbi:carbohydrate-binding protein [Chitinophaga agri]|uniref:Carbohydrate-binding protein n=1 Tax=Chitinophaga agri TaxID=2703787 RepID=A0A6B9ZB08_9BACT|nr:carbohydrate-binding protein [Chitinophaga agri]QHS59019.1 carbohydrate-binding protein [Chitinophaga agri]